MQRSSRFGLVLLGVLVWLAASTAVGQSFDAASRTVTVAPSGVDDTLAIATAFDVCQAVGPGCTVQLTEGTFFTRQQHVEGFRGTFAGAGMTATVVEPLTPYVISPARVDVSQRPADPGQGPVMFSFRDADIAIRDLAFVVRDPAPSEPWYYGPTAIVALAVILDFQGARTSADLERIAIESGPGAFFGLNVLNGVFFLPHTSDHSVPMVAKVRLSDSVIRGPWAGFSLSHLTGSTVVVRDTEFDARSSLEVDSVDDSSIVVVGNLLTGSEPGVVTLTADPGRTPVGPTTLLVMGNTLRVAGGDATYGVFVNDRRTPPSQFAYVAGNRFELDGTFAAVGGNADGVVVRDNVFVGRAAFGVRVGGSAQRPWFVTGNDTSGLDAARFDVLVSSSGRDAVVACNAGTTFRDDGRGTVAVGCDD